MALIAACVNFFFFFKREEGRLHSLLSLWWAREVVVVVVDVSRQGARGQLRKGDQVSGDLQLETQRDGCA